LTAPGLPPETLLKPGFQPPRCGPAKPSKLPPLYPPPTALFVNELPPLTPRTGELRVGCVLAPAPILETCAAASEEVPMFVRGTPVE
jgi:hypothetical protein